MTKFSIEAPCKINLHLAIGSRRNDGFHELESVFLALSLSDTLDFEIDEKTGGSTKISMDYSSLPPELIAPFKKLDTKTNIVYKAVNLFRKATGFDGAVKIHIKKNIPCGAGLGGGSSNAASTLIALNKTGLSFDIKTLAAELGSDVPFFLQARAALIRGRGEKIIRIFAPELFFVIIMPGFTSETVRAYRLFDEFHVRQDVIRYDITRFLTESPKLWPFKNDFLPVFMQAGTDAEKSAYSEMLYRLKESGADFAGLSGSGSSCFGVFKTGNAAKNAADRLSAHWPFVRLAVHTGSV
ncbi:MAG: 4-(cytidine 5'-diphospho)-2-C-methyl-D-erythritol kinase [Spirochaetaceae bacterium]|jgi:4-diphosphocytidyl-2-C-methyl-D-erythritol kinase|nr:4-(cytidine 5'-diphospho)-2-C-methyl-D-erythritol kinase [Spirochaetaceae bacterium]